MKGKTMKYSDEFEAAEQLMLDITSGEFEESWQQDRAWEMLDHYSMLSIARSLEKLAWKAMN
jgi:hypothetical protein